MELRVSAPWYPRTLEIEAEFKLGDPSKRTLSGIRVIVSWDGPGGVERGTELFITEESLTG